MDLLPLSTSSNITVSGLVSKNKSPLHYYNILVMMTGDEEKEVENDEGKGRTANRGGLKTQL